MHGIVCYTQKSIPISNALNELNDPKGYGSVEADILSRQNAAPNQLPHSSKKKVRLTDLERLVSAKWLSSTEPGLTTGPPVVDYSALKTSVSFLD